MSYELKGVRVAFVVANEGIEEVELLRPWRAVVDAGGTPEVVAPRPGMVETMRHLDRAGRFPVDQVTERALAADYDAAILPGGVANPDQLRTDAAAVDFLMALTEAGKPIAAICHGPWTLIEGDLVAGRTVTSWPSLQIGPAQRRRLLGRPRGRRVPQRHQHPRHQPETRGPQRVLPPAHGHLRAGGVARHGLNPLAPDRSGLARSGRLSAAYFYVLAARACARQGVGTADS